MISAEVSRRDRNSVSLQPLARIDDPFERAWAAGWVTAILAKECVTIGPTGRNTSGRR